MAQMVDARVQDEYLAGIARQDPHALEALYRAVSVSVHSYALSLLGDPHEAQDVLHDCFLAVWSAAPGYTSQGKPMAWLLTIARNLCLMRLRAQGNAQLLEPEEWARIPAPEDEGTEARLALDACMTRLSPEERQIVTLHAVSGLKHREIAALLELPLATVLSKYHRALKKMKRELEKGEPT